MFLIRRCIYLFKLLTTQLKKGRMKSLYLNPKDGAVREFAPKYKIMLEEMDKGIGKILDAVKHCNLADNSLQATK